MKTLGLVLSLCVVAAMANRAPAKEISDRAVPDGIEVLGWDAGTERIYYLVNGPSEHRETLLDSVRVLRYFDTRSSSPQQPNTVIQAWDIGQPMEAEELRREVRSLRSRLVAMPRAPLPRSTLVRPGNMRSVQVEDALETVTDITVEYDSLAGTWEQGVNGLRIRRIHLAPNGRDGVAILQNPGPPGSEFTVVLFISKRPHPPFQHDPTQSP